MTSNWKFLVLASAFLAMALSAKPAFAKQPKAIALIPGTTRLLDMCKGKAGSVEARRTGDSVSIIFRQVACSKFEIYGADNTVYKTYKIAGKTMPRSGSFTLPKAALADDIVKLRIRSNSGKHADWIELRVAPPRRELPLNTILAMPNCGGTVKIAHSFSRGRPQINVVLKGIEKCDTFTIEGNNGREIGKAYPIQGGKAGKRSASFGLSWKKVIDKGNWHYKKNQIAVRVSGRGVQELFVVTFIATAG